MRKYEVHFNIERPEGKRSLIVNTDDLDSLSQSAWFKEYIGLKDMLQTQMLQQQVAELRSALNEATRNQQVQPIIPASQQSVSAPVQQRPQVLGRKPGFMDISPDLMSESVWQTLSEEQRQQWMQHWRIQG